MEINITIKGIEQFTEAVALLASAIACDKGIKKTGSAAKEIAKAVQAVDKFEKEEVKEAEEKVVAEGPPAITIEEMRAAFLAKNSKANTTKLKAILNKFEVKKVTDLEEKDFEAVLEALEAI